LQWEAWAAALRSHPDAEFAGFILEGIQHGFRIGYNHKDHTFSLAHKNLPSVAEHPDIIYTNRSSQRQNAGTIPNLLHSGHSIKLHRGHTQKIKPREVEADHGSFISPMLKRK